MNWPYRVHGGEKGVEWLWDWLAPLNLDPKGRRFLALVQGVGAVLKRFGLDLCYRWTVGPPDHVQAAWLALLRPAAPPFADEPEPEPIYEASIILQEVVRPAPVYPFTKSPPPAEALERKAP
jgi:hypothetical protein